MSVFFENMKANRISVIAAFIHWFLLMIMQVDRNFFIYHAENKTMLISKLLAFFLLEAIWVITYRLYKDWKAGDSFSRRFVHIWGLYSLFLCLVLVIIWPGTWSWDDLWVLSNAQYYHTMAWQHVLSSYEQIILLQLFPSPGGYVLVKNLLIAALVAYVICGLESTFHSRPVFRNHYWLDILVKLLPFMLPPVLMYQFSGYRIGFYVYLEMLMLVVMVLSLKGAYHWSGLRVFLFAILVAVCASWRSESLLYAPLGVLFFCIGKNQSLTKMLRMAGVVLVVLFFGGLTGWQHHSLGNNNYEIVSTIRPAVELIRQAEPEKDKAELAAIDPVMDVAIVRAHPEHNGEVVYWADKAVREHYTRREYKAYLHSFALLTLRYPSVFWQERMHSFAMTSGLWGKRQYQNVDASVNMFNPEKDQYRAFKTIMTGDKYPSYPKLRSKAIHFMGMERKLKPIQPFYAIEWNIVVPLLVLIGGFIMLLKKQKWAAALILSFMLVKIPIVFLTAPSTWFMYYLSFYFLGYVLLDFYIVYRIGEKRKISVNER